MTDYNIFRYDFKPSENIIIISVLIFMNGLRPKGYAGTADHLGGCPGQNILEIKNSGRWPQLVGKREEDLHSSHGTVWFKDVHKLPRQYASALSTKLIHTTVYTVPSHRFLHLLTTNINQMTFLSDKSEAATYNNHLMIFP